MELLLDRHKKMSLDYLVKKEQFNKDYNIYYECVMSTRRTTKARRLYQEIKKEYNLNDKQMTDILYQHMRDLQIKYWPDVFKRYDY